MAWFLVQGYAVDPSQLPHPDHTLPTPQPPAGAQPPLGIWGPGQMPPGFWGGGMGPGVKPQPPVGGGSGPVDPGYSPPWARPPLGIWGPTDPRPTNPIYIPVTPPPESGLEPTHPIYIPVYPSHPIVIPEPVPPSPFPPETIEKVKKAIEFLTGNLPTDPNPKPEPV